MKNLECFLKYSEIKTPNVKYVACNDLKDEEGNPIEWELKKLTAKEANIAQDEAFKVDIEARDVQFSQGAYRSKVIAMSVDYPDLNNAELQNAFSVRTPEDLLQVMLSLGEYNALEKQVNLINGHSKSFNEVKKEAKN